MARKKIATIVSEKIHPFSLNEKGKAGLAKLEAQYSYDLLLECINIGISRYFKYDDNGELAQDSVNLFLDKLGGIAHNKNQTPIDQEISRLSNRGKTLFSYWDKNKACRIITEYVNALRSQGWDDSAIINDLQSETTILLNNSKHWTEWHTRMEGWIKDVKSWDIKDTVTIEQFGSVLPDDLFYGTSSNFQSLCRQINASYESNLYDCTAVIMRRLLECLLVLSYQKTNIEKQIMNKDGSHHVPLDTIIKDAVQNTTLALSANTKKDLALFKDLGNYSAHKIWYNCTQQDIKPHILKYRVIIEELMYKSGVKN